MNNQFMLHQNLTTVDVEIINVYRYIHRFIVTIIIIISIIIIIQNCELKTNINKMYN